MGKLNLTGQVDKQMKSRKKLSTRKTNKMVGLTTYLSTITVNGLNSLNQKTQTSGLDLKNKTNHLLPTINAPH
jgi:hypothetical protein